MRRGIHTLALSFFVASTGGPVVLVSSLVWAACDDHAPATGQTSTCTPPTADTTGVAAVAGSTNVTVNVLPGAQIGVTNINGVLVRDQSQVVNQGAISVSGDTFDGITSDLTGNNNTLINRGTITTTGAFSEGIFTTGSGSTLLNDTGGTITTSGHDSPGLHSFGGPGANILTNNGTIRTFGDNSSGIQAISSGGATSANNILTNNGTVITSGHLRTGYSETGTTIRSTTTGQSRRRVQMPTASTRWARC
ncbi:hypothetical protein QA641_44330 [Bradyrhizobium sp. CB1650]|uniref:hypothetical protein n=1 Tax=Bradyrhizobium sp. CB1650 TaxID=3039153 RepID=UPI00243499D6|nr:hypothetical protein [Bradyrhizobium sp. CB1650]WGD52345.1 hypothetical protein QA641_44330 [Bradyrhizobium sp. CB1650]